MSNLFHSDISKSLFGTGFVAITGRYLDKVLSYSFEYLDIGNTGEIHSQFYGSHLNNGRNLLKIRKEAMSTSI